MQIEKSFVMKYGPIGDNSIWYRIGCDCMEPKCDLTLELEKVTDHHSIYLNMYKNLHASAYWGYDSDSWRGKVEWLRVLLNKLLLCWKIMTKGYLEISESMIIREQHIDDFIGALQEGKKFLCRHSESQECKNGK
jgi:hypothetical protein